MSKKINKNILEVRFIGLKGKYITNFNLF